MAKISFTPDQQKVIDLRDRNILVSAAAGSGKTAVLVERIITMITDHQNPIDIDRLLIVTFTKAAAGEMKERIGNAIEKKMIEEPDNEHLQRQMTLIHNAQITTIDSFCLSVVRNNFHLIDLDPSFRIGDDAELTLLKSDVMGELLEEEYEKGDEDFLEFVECYSGSKSDTELEDFITRLYNFSMSYPWPEEWLVSMGKAFELTSVSDLSGTEWMQRLLEYIDSMIMDAREINQEAMAMCHHADGPMQYLDALASDAEQLDRFHGVTKYEEYGEVLSSLNFKRLSTKKDPNASDEKKEAVKALRNQVKDMLAGLAKDFFFQSPEEMAEDIMRVKKPMLQLIRLTLEFIDRFAKKKEEKNLLDFADLEHNALRILVEKKDGIASPTQAAIDLSEQFAEIMIDEYQDSNLVQETILTSISTERIGKPNVFMVGDVKQSIYKFRLARPELFMDKYHTYTTEDSKYQKIDLHKNFRSRAVVLDSINKVFERIMRKNLGGIEYNADAALYPGASYPERDEMEEDEVEKSILIKKEGQEESQQCETQDAQDLVNAENPEEIEVTGSGKTETKAEATAEMKDSAKTDTKTAKDFDPSSFTAEQARLYKKNGFSSEMIILETEDDSDSTLFGETEDESEEAAEAREYTNRELEAKAIAKRIKEILDPKAGMLVTEKDGTLRKARYRDIVILLRTMSGWSEVFTEVLLNEGIPAYSDTQSGYFKTAEIQTVLNYLRILDNPLQDIPFTAVLYSPIGGITSEELSLLRLGNYKRISEKGMPMYELALDYAERGLYEPLKQKMQDFLQTFDELRDLVAITPVHELILEIFKRTHYDLYVSAMPAGEKRKSNLNQLVQKAIAFENTSYHGLFQFVRYIEKLLKYEIDYGESATAGENDDTVRIMSIHKSKGLEFPIVFVAGMGKQFNNSDSRAKIVLHADYGIGPDCIDYKMRTKCPTLLKKVIQRQGTLENLGEELRILYVALTRAKEKLIMIGGTKDAGKLIADWRKENLGCTSHLRFSTIASARNYFDFVGPAIIPLQAFSIDVIKKEGLTKDEIQAQISKAELKEQMLHPANLSDEENEIRAELKRRLIFLYPFLNEATLPIKTTVSELKKLSQTVDAEDADNLIEEIKESQGVKEDESEEEFKEAAEEMPEETEKKMGDGQLKEAASFEDEATYPKFLKEEEEVKATARGTLYHKVLESMEFTKMHTAQDVKDLVARLCKEEVIDKELAGTIRISKLAAFLKTSMAERIRKAEAAGKFYKEQQFVLGIPSLELNPQFGGSEIVLIQGIIDAYFEEDGKYVLIDYKTDRVNDEEELIARYAKQLEYYERALVQITGKRVKEKIIYSFGLMKEIHLD